MAAQTSTKIIDALKLSIIMWAKCGQCVLRRAKCGHWTVWTVCPYVGKASHCLQPCLFLLIFTIAYVPPCTFTWPCTERWNYSDATDLGIFYISINWKSELGKFDVKSVYLLLNKIHHNKSYLKTSWLSSSLESQISTRGIRNSARKVLTNFSSLRCLSHSLFLMADTTCSDKSVSRKCLPIDIQG